MIESAHQKEINILLKRIEYLEERRELNFLKVERVVYEYLRCTKTPLDGALLDSVIKVVL